MFQIGDRVVYCQTGVCDVQAVSSMRIPGMSDDALYYTLKPLFCEATVFVPVDTKKPLRPVMTPAEADALIDSIPNIQVCGPDSMDIKLWTERYRALSSTCDCSDLLALVMLIHDKKSRVERNSKSLGQTDQAYMKNAENLLHGELAVALGILRDDVPAYIQSRIRQRGKRA